MEDANINKKGVGFIAEEKNKQKYRLMDGGGLACINVLNQIVPYFVFSMELSPYVALLLAVVVLTWKVMLTSPDYDFVNAPNGH